MGINTLNNLVIDTDESIFYKKSKIDSSCKSLSLPELFEIFKYCPEDIFIYNTSDCINFINDNHEDIDLSKIEKDQKHLSYLKIATPELKENDNDLIISLNTFESFIRPWQFPQISNADISKPISIEQAITDYNGYNNCEKYNSNNDNTILHIAPHYMTVENSILIKYFQYLPSAGQMKIITDYIDLISYAINYVSANIEFNVNKFKLYNWWTSTVSSDNYAYCIYDGSFRLLKFDNFAFNFPLFKQFKHKYLIDEK